MSADGLRTVQQRIAAAAQAAGRPADDVRLIAVSKTFPVERIREIAAAGQRLFGENKVQEALAKQDELDNIEWHLIGPLQRNKARQVVGRFALLHGVDSIRLVDELQRRAANADVRQPILLQVRLGGEETKSGVDAEELSTLVDHVLDCPALELRGLMTIPSREEPQRWFAQLRELAEKERTRSGLALPELSMGMSGDYELAIAEGATLVRVGRAIFGERA